MNENPLHAATGLPEVDFLLRFCSNNLCNNETQCMNFSYFHLFTNRIKYSIET